MHGWILGAGALAGAVAAIIGLLHVVLPGSDACVGNATAKLVQLDSTRTGPLEARLSYTLETHGYQGSTLNVVWSLLRRDRTSSFIAVPGFSRVPAAQLKPTSCTSDEGGADILVPVTDAGVYRVVLEVFPPSGARITRRSIDLSLTRG